MPFPGPREILDRWRAASITRSPTVLAALYDQDAVHEFPFTRPGFPARLKGRDEIVTWITTGWRESPLRYTHYRTQAIHDTTDPNTIVVAQEAVGTSEATGPVTLPNLLVLTTRAGRITHLHDYVDIPAAEAALGLS
ncbi:hypothetical protein BLA60_23225 [Actinophytocola xinjiangensis]|uniref:SnoaL-like domain-containing protein n=1 Tax=Actinophytocola xinjiangensis TaxID=485602 RepID=A0A7Z1AWW3_9PSEU|nr:nuclear transport factor 2 family protein [Actinophytocola xinjiangensis]OLF08344.1 hypothetical protein BLA60_23225 [Actinophytocola xinjiangensis]